MSSGSSSTTSSIRTKKRESEFTWDFFKHVTKFKLVSREIIKCVSCGRCVGNCPAGMVTDYNIRDIIRRVLDGDESVLTDPTLFDCFMCGMCIIKCPKKGLRPPEVIQNLREYAINKKVGGLDALRHLIPHVENFFATGSVVKEFPATEKAVKEINIIAEMTGMKKILEKRKKVVAAEE
ncbi:MAG: 4Fe-4S dicluster domain-containing protein [Promethearchaeota archaeon]